MKTDQPTDRMKVSGVDMEGIIQRGRIGGVERKRERTMATIRDSETNW